MNTENTLDQIEIRIVQLNEDLARIREEIEQMETEQITINVTLRQRYAMI